MLNDELCRLSMLPPQHRHSVARRPIRRAKELDQFRGEGQKINRLFNKNAPLLQIRRSHRIQCLGLHQRSVSILHKRHRLLRGALEIPLERHAYLLIIPIFLHQARE
jgi:hypothetical protein